MKTSMSNVLLHQMIAVGTRTVIVSLYLILGLRLLGKRQMGQINIYDLALILLVANAVQNAMTEGLGSLGVGVASAGTLLLLGAGFSYLFVRLPRLEQRLIGTPTVIIRDGVLLKENARRENVTHDALMQILREHDLCQISDVRLAVLETDGTLSVIPYPESQTAPSTNT